MNNLTIIVKLCLLKINSFSETFNSRISSFVSFVLIVLNKCFDEIYLYLNGEGGHRGECHCRRTVSCALGAPVKRIVSSGLASSSRARARSKAGRTTWSVRRIRRYAWYFHENSLIPSRQKCPYWVATHLFYPFCFLFVFFASLLLFLIYPLSSFLHPQLQRHFIENSISINLFDMCQSSCRVYTHFDLSI